MPKGAWNQQQNAEINRKVAQFVATLSTLGNGSKTMPNREQIDEFGAMLIKAGLALDAWKTKPKLANGRMRHFNKGRLTAAGRKSLTVRIRGAVTGQAQQAKQDPEEEERRREGNARMQKTYRRKKIRPTCRQQDVFLASSRTKDEQALYVAEHVKRGSAVLRGALADACKLRRDGEVVMFYVFAALWRPDTDPGHWVQEGTRILGRPNPPILTSDGKKLSHKLMTVHPETLAVTDSWMLNDIIEETLQAPKKSLPSCLSSPLALAPFVCFSFSCPLTTVFAPSRQRTRTFQTQSTCGALMVRDLARDLPSSLLILH
jgi:hypothetical protein